MLNPQMKSTATKKKNNNKKKATKTNDNQVDKLVDNVEQQIEDQNVQNNTAAKKKKSKSKNNENITNENNTQSPNADEWVLFGKPKKSTTPTASLDKATRGVKNLTLESKKVKEKQPIKKRNNLATLAAPDDIASDMLIDNHQEEDNEEAKIEKNNEKQLLIKKIKTLRKKLKDIETLKELSKTKSLDKEQNAKISKLAEFTIDLAEVQAKLDLINSNK